MSSIADNITQINNELGKYSCRIIAVSKYVGIEKIQQAYDAGIRDFAESKAQDALVKMESLSDEVKNDISWHFIGHLQSNKAKKIVGNFDYIHSVDSLKLAELINDLAKDKGFVQKILLQVNIADETTKFGFMPEELIKVFHEIISLKNISVEGLMMMAPYLENKDELGSLFSALREFGRKLECEFGFAVKEFSMGMSNDYKVAVKEGSTMVRIGTKIFK